MSMKLTFLSCTASALMLLMLISNSCVSARTLANCPVSGTLDDISKCDWQGYLKEIYPPVIWAFALGILLIPLGLLFFCGRYCCNCCGGRGSHPGWCCPDSTRDVNYTKCSIISTKLLVFLAFVGTLLAVFLVWRADDSTREGVLNGFTEVNVTLAKASNTVKIITDTVSSLNVRINHINSLTGQSTTCPSLNTSLMQDITKNIDKASGYVVDGRYQYDKWERYAFYGLMCFVGIPAFWVLCGLVAAIANARGCGACFVMVLLVLTGPGILFMCGIYQFGGILSYDVCDDVDLALSANGQSVFQNVLPCSLLTNFTNLVNVTSNVTQMENEVLKTLSSSLAKKGLCTGCVYGSPGCLIEESQKLKCGNYLPITTLQNATNALNGITLMPAFEPYCQVSNCTLRKCASNCTMDVLKNSSMVGVDVEASCILGDVIVLQVKPFLTCKSFLNWVLGFLPPVCKTISDGFTKTFIGLAVSGVAIIFGIFALGFGLKRFIPLSEAEFKTSDDLNQKMMMESYLQFK